MDLNDTIAVLKSPGFQAFLGVILAFSSPMASPLKAFALFH
jgi:hypothetical protein